MPAYTKYQRDEIQSLALRLTLEERRATFSDMESHRSQLLKMGEPVYV